MPRPQFSLKAMFVMTAVLSVPLGMLVSGESGLYGIACLAFFLGVGGNLGYLLGGPKHIPLGVAVGKRRNQERDRVLRCHA